MRTKHIIIPGYNAWEDRYLIGCRKCITQQNFLRGWDNLLYSHFLWPLIILPKILWTLLKTTIKGHSSAIKQIVNENQLYLTQNDVLKIYHSWKGLPGLLPRTKYWIKQKYIKSLDKATQEKSIVWLVKALAYFNETTFNISPNGKIIFNDINDSNSGVFAAELENINILGYRDFFIIPDEYKRLTNSLIVYISQWNEGFSFVQDMDHLSNIHIHIINKYEINYDENPLGQLSWIVETIEEYKLTLLRWFNSEKLKKNDDITKQI